MNVLLVSKNLGYSASLTVSRGRVLGLLLALFVVLPALSLYGGYLLGTEAATLRPEQVSVALNSELNRQQKQLETVRLNAENNINALTMRLGQMQASMIRLDALGQRLANMAKLEKGEFDFSNPPAQGGPQGTVLAESVALPDFMEQIDDLSLQLQDREQQLNVLESMLMSRNLRDAVLPTGSPITKGWLSSKFGTRNDPFSGKPEFHKGIDMASAEGNDIIAAGAGVITWSAKRYGYGNMVEIDHGNGYVTRYGHAKKLLVKSGDTVEKGQRIALVGNSGRSTGPHVHYEVWLNGRTVNPEKYMRASR